VLYSAIVTLTNLLNAALSAHMIGMLAGLGLGVSEAVRIAAVRGIGQSASRLADVLSRSRLDPLTLNLVANLALPFSFAIGLMSGRITLAAYAFSFLSGVANGLLTITRGTLPLVLFEQRTYGVVVGWLLLPSFLASAAAPLLYAVVIDHAGSALAFVLSAGVATVASGAAIVLRLQFAGLLPFKAPAR
jgi:hypothetical protein